MASAAAAVSLPTGFSVLTTFPDLLFIPEFDAFYHSVAALFYLSAAVLQATATIGAQPTNNNANQFKIYQEDIAAVVFAFLATLTYVIHKGFSLLRWKSS
ncbi:myelin and lymphocyte protein isoform X3 [Emys orbicularis]|uniref:myelin and lymphocyte protein isoform X3 n=1 Tax=Emys orbicularis TaxID=82168 RepID=UPI0031FCE060